MKSAASQKRRHFSSDLGLGTVEKSAGATSGEYGECSSAVTLFFAKKSLTKSDQ
jgi:hypothetical protein